MAAGFWGRDMELPTSWNRLTALVCAVVLVTSCVAPSEPTYQSKEQASAPQQPAAAKIPNDQLDSLVAPLALYPDPLLAQVLAASTYPLEIVQLQQWMGRHTDLKGE